MKKLIKIYAERNTGTNYLENLIRLNLDVKILKGKIPFLVYLLGYTIQKKMPNLFKNYFIYETFEDVYYKISSPNNLGWKHELITPQRIKEINAYKNPIYFVTLIKNPYSWLLSLHRNPYGPAEINTNFEQFLAEPFKTLKRENHPEHFENPIILWNEKNKLYMQLKSNLPAIIIKYEDLLSDPKSAIDSISRQFNLKKRSDDFKNKTESTKGETKNFSYYQNYYLNEIWKEKLNKKSIEIINKYLDEDLLNYFGYKKIKI
jgi:hypothetical protein